MNWRRWDWQLSFWPLLEALELPSAFRAFFPQGGLKPFFRPVKVLADPADFFPCRLELLFAVEGFVYDFKGRGGRRAGFVGDFL